MEAARRFALSGSFRGGVVALAGSLVSLDQGDNGSANARVERIETDNALPAPTTRGTELSTLGPGHRIAHLDAQRPTRGVNGSLGHRTETSSEPADGSAAMGPRSVAPF